jgi:SAM-dependent methyltransferase
MTRFELLYRTIGPLEHPLYQHVRRTLKRLNPRRLLDVGGRRSNYTIGLSEVWISDIPREKEIQHQLDLGATDAIRSNVLKRRSNVRDYIYDDMTATKIEPESFDVVNATEVLEHVEEDERFVANVARVLKPGGHFVMSTPNGDWKPVPYPDHKRHYRADDLEILLLKHFRDVHIEYRVNAGWLHTLACKSGLHGLWAYGVSNMLENFGIGGRGPNYKHHLFAVCRK